MAAELTTARSPTLSTLDLKAPPFMPVPTHLQPAHAHLVEVVRTHGYRYSEEPFRLSSGELSHDFVDGKAALASGRDLAAACRLMVDWVSDAGVRADAVGGLTMGADQFAHGVAVLFGWEWFVVRKERKGRGTDQLVEGRQIGEGARVLLVDDAVTTGGSVLKAHEAVAATGATIVAASTLVDRGEIGAAHFRRLGIPYFPLITYRDLDIPPVGG